MALRQELNVSKCIIFVEETAVSYGCHAREVLYPHQFHLERKPQQHSFQNITYENDLLYCLFKSNVKVFSSSSCFFLYDAAVRGLY